MAIKVTLELKDQEYLQAFVRMMSLHPLFCPSDVSLGSDGPDGSDGSDGPDGHNGKCTYTDCEECWHNAVVHNAVTLRHRIEDFLCGVGIQPRLRGFTYLVDAIEYVMDYGDEAHSAMCTYDIVALKRDVPDYSVEKCMRYAIRKSSVKINSWAFIVDTAYRLAHGKEVNDSGK